MSKIEYLRICADEDGCSHFEIMHIDLEAMDYAPPAPALNISALESADNYTFLELPVG